jgi:hypothetical protein
MNTDVQKYEAFLKVIRGLDTLLDIMPLDEVVGGVQQALDELIVLRIMES